MDPGNYPGHNFGTHIACEIEYMGYFAEFGQNLCLIGYSREFAGAVFGNCVVESESLWEFGAWEGGWEGGGEEA